MLISSITTYTFHLVKELTTARVAAGKNQKAVLSMLFQSFKKHLEKTGF